MILPLHDSTFPRDKYPAAGDLADWLRGYKWDYWVTARCAAPVSAERLPVAVRHWLDALTRVRHQVYKAAARAQGTVYRAGERRAYAAYAVERGPLMGGLHVHALIGGLGAHPAVARAVASSWSLGQVLSSPYDPRLDPAGDARHGAAAYLIKHAGAVDLCGRLQRVRRRGAPRTPITTSAGTHSL